MLRTRSPRCHTLVGLPPRPGLSVSRALCAPPPGPRLRAGAIAPGRPAPSQLAVLSAHPPDGQAPRAPCAVTTEVWGDLPGRGSGLLVHPRCHRPGSPSRPSPLLCGLRTGLGALRTAQHGQVAALLQPTHHQGGTCYPTAPCSVKSSAENPSQPLAAPGRGRGQLCPVSSRHSHSGAFSVTTCLMACTRELCWGPCTRGTRCRVRRLACAHRLLTLRGADPSLCFEVNSSAGLRVSSTGLQLQDPHGHWEERGQHYLSKNPNSPRNKTCQGEKTFARYTVHSMSQIKFL